jgi:hypothetical protein
MTFLSRPVKFKKAVEIIKPQLEGETLVIGYGNIQIHAGILEKP